MIDRDMLEAYQRRWQVVADMEAQERQQVSVAHRWRQLNALLRMAAALGLQPTGDSQQDDMVRQRWNRLTEAYLAQAERRLR